MQRPLEIAFRDLDPSDFIRNLVEERVDRLERFHPHIIGCRVVVEAPHRSAEGHNPPIGISVEVDVPARPRIIAKDAEAQRAMKGDHLAAINRAFEAVERQLDELKTSSAARSSITRMPARPAAWCGCFRSRAMASSSSPAGRNSTSRAPPWPTAASIS